MNLVLLPQAGSRRRSVAYVIAWALTVVALVAAVGAAPALVATTVICWSCFVVAAALVDMRTGRLPDILVLPGIVGVLALSLLAERLSGAVFGAFLLGLPMLSVHLARPEGLGFGDVKFGLLLGAGIGVVAVPLVLPAYLVAAVAHAVVCVVVRARGRLVPFGPALAGASILTAVAGLLWRL